MLRVRFKGSVKARPNVFSIDTLVFLPRLPGTRRDMPLAIEPALLGADY